MRTFIGLLVASASLLAQEVALELDPTQTQVNFTLGDVLHTVHGTFKLKRGSFRFDNATGAAEGSFAVDVPSGQSGSDARDKRMHKEILESQKYPEAVFTAGHMDGRIAPQGESKISVHGTFRIHGADHEMVLPVAVRNKGGQYEASIHFVIPYVKWGMKNPSNFLLKVNPEVEVDIKTTARPGSAVVSARQ